MVESKEADEDTRRIGLKIGNGKVNSKEASVLRDTGCTSILMTEKLIKEEDLTGGVREVTLANGCVMECPEVWIEVDTNYVKGKVLAIVMNTLFADLIVGNYTRLDVPTEIKKDGELARSQTDVFQTVETRSSTKRKTVEKEEVESSLELGKEISTDEWIEEQSKDPALDVLRERVGNDMSKECETLITLEKGMLYRHFKSPTKEVIKQLVVPTEFRRQILQLGHDIPMTGHLGIKKTREKILKYFFWPGIFNDTKQNCRACPKCQKGTSKTQVSKVPFVQIPRIDVPFQQIAIDMVGPLPRTKRGNQYVLVICDYATKYPVEIPLRSQEAEVVAEAMVEVFSRLGDLV